MFNVVSEKSSRGNLEYFGDEELKSNGKSLSSSYSSLDLNLQDEVVNEGGGEITQNYIQIIQEEDVDKSSLADSNHKARVLRRNNSDNSSISKVSKNELMKEKSQLKRRQSYTKG